MYAKINDGVIDQYPYETWQLRRDFPNVSLPRGYPDHALRTLGIHRVVEMPPPDHDPATQRVEEADPVADGEQWVQAWRIVDLTQDERDAWLANARGQKAEEAIAEASRRRQVVLDAVTPGGLADYVSLMGRALAGVRREAKGRADANEIARLNALESLAGQVEAIDTARDTIIAEIEQHGDPASYDVPGSPHWP